MERELEEVHALSDSTPHSRGDSIQGRGRVDEAPVRETWGLISASLGAMRPLVAKLDKLLLAHPNDGMRLLSDDVKKISSYVDQLSELEDPPPTAKCWMNEARGLSYDMEDYIDSSLLVEPAGPSLVAGGDMEAIAVMVSEFSKYVKEAIERHKAYVVPDPGAGLALLRRRFVSLSPMLPAKYEDIVIDGRMKEFIKSFAEDEDKQLKVVSLLGSACLGKTTLATVLYSQLGKRYDCRAFIRVSRKPDTKRIFLDMLWQLQRQDPPEYRYEVDLIDNIKKYLRNKRYLIIIDDVWTASVWDTINDALPKGSHGSRIVTTTQIQDVALTCCCHQPKLVFEMKPLDEDHSRELFFNRLFGSETGCPEIFKDVSNEIIEMCGGLPLATSSIASLLASQPVITQDLLEHIRESLSSCFSASERTRQALNLGFNNLPHYLKTCLLCLGMYPEGYTFCTDDLLKQWMAEGFIDTRQGQDAEEVAESYLHQLIGRRFVQPIRINYNNEVLSCAVLDTVHDLIAHKSAEDNFIVAIDYSQKNVALSFKARRLSFLFGDARYAKAPANITKPQVRSLVYFGLFEGILSIIDYKLLRVLVLQISGHGGEDNPVDLTGISELIQLRYLRIGCGICIKLPINGLKRLETLDITDAIVINSSKDLIHPRLLHLSLPLERIMMYCRPNALNYEEGINTDDLSSLIKGHDNLRTVIFSHGSTVKNKVVRGDIKVIMPKPSKEAITSGAPLLQEFECSPASGTIFFVIPKWFKDLENLCILKIAVKILKMDCVGILRGLRALTALSLHVRRETAERIIFEKAGFSALKYFNLRFTTGIPWLIFEKDTMPNLWKLKLVFNDIPKMDKRHFFVSSLPGRPKQYKAGNPLIVIDHMPSLREIYVKFEGAAADLEHIARKGISVDQGINPAIVNMKLVDSSSYGEQSKKQAEDEETTDETLDGESAEKFPRSSKSLHVFTLDELISATSNFTKAHFEGDNCKPRNLERTFCRPGVYAGSFKSNLRPGLKPQKVIVKCVNKLSNDHEWMMVGQKELEYLGTFSRHPNLVKLLGFCDYYEHRMLVYEEMPTKSLKHYFSDFTEEPALPWLTRLKIAVGTAKVLAFLHNHNAEKPMVHGDLKASSILLDKDHKPKLFGYRLVDENSPDSLTAERDVYNFGGVLLELLAGGRQTGVKERPLMEAGRQVGVEWWHPFLSRQDKLQNIMDPRLEGKYSWHAGVKERPLMEAGRQVGVEWWRPYLSRQDKLQSIMDPRLKGKYSWHAAWGTATIVRRCLLGVPEKRPSMLHVVKALEPLLLLDDDDDDKPSKNADKDAGAGASDDGRRQSTIQLDVSSSRRRYPPEWVGTGSGRPHEFTLDELMSATSNFSEENLLGEADFGRIYKGAIDDGKLMVAVMKLRPDCDDWLVPREWLAELQRLESMHNPHLVRLLGCCDQDEQCVLLVYEYMPRGSLSQINESIPWVTRLEIAVGAARGLSFVHESQGTEMIYYTGFTASSILLDADYTVKLWGFGPAPRIDDFTVSSRMRKDVYNFGVVLLELLVGRSALEEKRRRLVPGVERRRRLVPEEEWKWLSRCIRNEEELHKIMDPRLKGQYPVRAASSTAEIAWQCLQSDEFHHGWPYMGQVVRKLLPLLAISNEETKTTLTTTDE